jgi:anhydro-N-acetylmuramic acid kinase
MTTYHVIGIMSGTSCDGLDLAYCRFTKVADHWDGSILHADTISFGDVWRKRLNTCHELPVGEFLQTDIEFGQWIGKQVRNFCEIQNICPELISCHGHTVIHNPARSISCQIGNALAIHHETGIPVANNFRQLDILLGGQGAPLVPVGDALLFPTFDICLNIGGIANATFRNKENILAFDICPANILLNHFSHEMGYLFDRDGELASKGKASAPLLEALNAYPYYLLTPPKSLDKWMVLNEYVHIIAHFDLSIPDILCTLCHHIAAQINHSLFQYAPNSGKVLLTGGGALNKFLVQCLLNKVDGKYQIVIPDQRIIEYKEAYLFGLLGVLKMRREINTLASVTGAPVNSSGGILYP